MSRGGGEGGGGWGRGGEVTGRSEEAEKTEEKNINNRRLQNTVHRSITA